MLSTKEFFQSILHTEGCICIVGIRNKKARQFFVDTIDEAIATARELDDNGVDAYFACATFKEKTNRTQENILALKSFFIDLDCGPNKPYQDQSEALAALRKFCTEQKYPIPTVVNSGGGIHAYWPLDSSLTKDIWKETAEAFKVNLQTHGLHADPAITADAARILRIPGTRNYKQADEPRRVSILAATKSVSAIDRFLDFDKGTSSSPSSLKLLYKTEPDAVTLALIGNVEASFRKILVKTSKGEGCGQIKRITEDQNGVGEPLWRGGLSVAQFCTDREVAIHLISRDYNGYSPEETEKKAAQTKGPYTCATFEGLNPEGCEGCPLKGKITSPIQIGRLIKEYKGDTQPIRFEPASGVSALKQIEIPKDFPKGYFRGQHGGIYKRILIEEIPEDVLIYDHDIFATKRFSDPEKGDVIEVNLKLPHDDLRKFLMPMSGLMAREGARQEFASRGVALVTKGMDNLIDYMVHWANCLERKERAEVSRMQMGWTLDDTFVMGDTEITRGADKWTPPSPSTRNVVDALTCKGTLEGWEDVINQVYGKEGMEAQSFALLAGFGATLFKWTHHDGVILNLLSKTSGSGKSTLCYAINSAFGHPKDLMMMWDDTKLVKYQRIGIMCNLPVTVDEITNWTPEAASDFAYGITQGRGRHRLKSSANEERMNITKWSTIAITTSNASLYDKISILKSMSEGEMYRIFEIFIQSLNQISKEESDKVLHKLASNYGHAGRLFIDFAVKNLPAIQDRLQKVRAEFDRAVNMTLAERNWSALMAAAFTAGLILKNDLGLIKNIDLDKVYKYMINCVQEVRKTTKKLSVNGSSLLGQYINEIYNNVLVIDNAADKRSHTYRAPSKEPRGELLVRIEPDTKRGYITAGHFRKYCGDQQVPYMEIMKYLTDRKIALKTEKKRMGKGTSINTPPVEAIVIDTDHAEFTFEFEEGKAEI